QKIRLQLRAGRSARRLRRSGMKTSGINKRSRERRHLAPAPSVLVHHKQDFHGWLLWRWSGHREREAADGGGDRDQLGGPGARDRRGEVAEVVAEESTRSVDTAAAGFIEVQDDLAARALVGEVELCHGESSRHARGGGEGVSGVLALELDGGVHRGAGGQC